MAVDTHPERKVGTMTGGSSTLGQRWTNGKQDTLVSGGILAYIAALLAFVMAVVLVFAVLPHAEIDVSPSTVAGIGASSAPWSLLDGYYSGESKASTADVARWNIVSEWPTAEVIQGP